LNLLQFSCERKFVFSEYYWISTFVIFHSQIINGGRYISTVSDDIFVNFITFAYSLILLIDFPLKRSVRHDDSNDPIYGLPKYAISSAKFCLWCFLGRSLMPESHRIFVRKEIKRSLQIFDSSSTKSIPHFVEMDSRIPESPSQCSATEHRNTESSTLDSLSSTPR